MLAILAAGLLTGIVPPPTSGRMHDVSGNPGAISAWTDAGQCRSSFGLKLTEGKPLAWSVDWSKVETIRVETQSSFESDPAADLYASRTGLVVAGAGAFAAKLGDRTIEADSFEYFLATPAEAERLRNVWTRRAAGCLPAG
jgi:hypothetical protein